jgi:hypothetical protein
MLLPWYDVPLFCPVRLLTSHLELLPCHLVPLLCPVKYLPYPYMLLPIYARPNEIANIQLARNLTLRNILVLNVGQPSTRLGRLNVFV